MLGVEISGESVGHDFMHRSRRVYVVHPYGATFFRYIFFSKFVLLVIVQYVAISRVGRKTKTVTALYSFPKFIAAEHREVFLALTRPRIMSASSSSGRLKFSVGWKYDEIKY